MKNAAKRNIYTTGQNTEYSTKISPSKHQSELWWGLFIDFILMQPEKAAFLLYFMCVYMGYNCLKPAKSFLQYLLSK